MVTSTPSAGHSLITTSSVEKEGAEDTEEQRKRGERKKEKSLCVFSQAEFPSCAPLEFTVSVFFSSGLLEEREGVIKRRQRADVIAGLSVFPA